MIPLPAAAGVLRRLVAGARTLENTLLPARCAVCNAALPWSRPEDQVVCARCLPRRIGPDVTRCSRCGRPLISEIGTCTACRTREFSFTAHRSAFRYRAARILLHRYKFEGRRQLAGLLASELLPLLQGQFAGVPLVPVPARRGAVRKRGFDPVALLASRLGREGGVPVLRILRRSGGKPQKALGYAERIENLRGRITVRGRKVRKLANRGRFPQSVVLIDDVFTTGATAHECARTLRGAGVESVFVLTIAMD